MSINDLFFRPFDKARLERLVMAIHQDKLSAALVCDSEGLLDHYGRMLVKKLRAVQNLSVEVYYPNSTEALLNRFNRILEDVSMDSAVNPDDSQAPNRVLVAFDSQATGIREVQLMARLVKDFPGANTRIILMLDKLSSTQYEKKIEAFGNKIIRWDIATPTDREAAVLISESELSGMQPEVRQALANVGVSLDAKLALAASSKALSRAEKTLSPEPEIKTNQQNQDGVNVPIKKDDEKTVDIQNKKNEAINTRDTTEKSSKLNQRKKIEKINAFVASLFLLLVSGGVMAWVTLTEALSIEKVVAEMRSLLLNTPEITRLKEIQENEKNRTKFASSSEPINNFDQKTNNALNDLQAQKSKKIESEVVLDDKNVSLDNSEQQTDNKSLQVKSPTPNILIETNAENSLGIEKSSQQILKPGFYVQHTARPSKGLAEELQKKYPSLSRALILKLKKTKSDGHFFVLVSGPFATLDEAKAFTMRGDIPDGTWIRGALGMRPLMVPVQ